MPGLPVTSNERFIGGAFGAPTTSRLPYKDSHGLNRQIRGRGVTLDEVASNEELRLRRERAALRSPTPVVPGDFRGWGGDDQRVNGGEVSSRGDFDTWLRSNGQNVCCHIFSCICSSQPTGWYSVGPSSKLYTYSPSTPSFPAVHAICLHYQRPS